METTLDEARRCPKCKEPGKEASKVPAKGGTRGAMLYSYMCVNKRCRWNQTICRVVQINPDGSIPPPMEKRDKAYPARVDLTRQIEAQMQAQLRQETQGNS